jgi:DNA adenine methylase
LINFWQVLRNESLFREFQRLCETTPFAEAVWGQCTQWLGVEGQYASVRDAWAFFVHCRQSLAGRMDSFAAITRRRTRRGMNEQVSAWLNAIEGLPAVHTRLKRVLILNDNALTVIRNEDGPRTLFYLDPPYLHETRATIGEYLYEMTYQQHRDLLEALKGIEGRFMLSGYDSDLYRGYANTVPRWNRHEFDLPNNAAGGKNKRRMVECVWTNF